MCGSLLLSAEMKRTCSCTQCKVDFAHRIGHCTYVRDDVMFSTVKRVTVCSERTV